MAVYNAPSDCQEGLQDNPQIPPSEVSRPALEPSEGKETDHTSERRNDQEEEELQTLLPRLLDAFDPDTPPGEVHVGFCHLSCYVCCLLCVCVGDMCQYTVLVGTELSM